MKRRLTTLAVLLILASAHRAHAAATFQIIGDGFANGVSADGATVVGALNGTYEVFRWTQATGVVPLGMCSGCVLGRVAGFGSISRDGTAIAGSILTADSVYVTPGLWTAGQWQQVIPPVPAEGGLIDDAYGSAWTVSGDGRVVGGLYWRPGQPGGLAHAFRWSAGGGFTDLGSSGMDSRVSAASYDGSVMAGWDSDPVDAHWRATVWVNDTLVTLSTSEAFTEAHAVTPDGRVVAGMDYDDVAHLGIAALWTHEGAGWSRTVIGALPGTFSYYGEAHALALTPDAHTVVGYNQFDNASGAGFVWTDATGMQDITQVLAEQGVDVPADFIIRTLTGVSDDGRTMVGAGQQIFFPYSQKWFVIHFDTPLAVGDASRAALRLSTFPNPLRGQATVAFSLPRAAAAELGIFDAAGRRVRRLLSGPLGAGEHLVRWDGGADDGAPAAPGVYYLRLRTDAGSASSRLVVVH